MLAHRLVLALLVTACGAPPRSRVTTAKEPVATADDPCPVAIPGTSVAVIETPTGGALVFVTTGDAVALRARVTAWADGHNQRHAAMGPLPTGDEVALVGHAHHEMESEDTAEPAAATGLVAMIGAHSRATATPIDGGVRLEVVTSPDQIRILRDELREAGERLGRGTCTMPPND